MRRSLNVGEFVHQVTIQQLTETRSAVSKGPVESWTTLTEVWMARTASSGTESFRANQLSGSSVTIWAMRYLASMDPDLVDVPKQRRLFYQGRAYDILEAQVMDRHVGIVLRTLANTEVPA